MGIIDIVPLGGGPTRIVGLHTNITASQANRDYFEKLAQSDALTGLYSRTYFDIKLANIENKGIPPVVCDFLQRQWIEAGKYYMGHLVGDKLLQTVALLCKERVRTADCVARMGGDEIVVLMPACSRKEGEEILSKLRQNFDRHNVCYAATRHKSKLAHSNEQRFFPSSLEWYNARSAAE